MYGTNQLHFQLSSLTNLQDSSFHETKDRYKSSGLVAFDHPQPSYKIAGGYLT